MIIYLKSELYDFCYLQQNAFDKEDAYCPLEQADPALSVDQSRSLRYHFIFQHS